MKRDPIHNPANTDLKLKNIPVERQICEARRPSPGLEHQPNLVQDVKEVHRPSHVKDVKDVKDVKVAKVVKDVKDIKDVEDVKDVEDFEDVMVENAEFVPQPNHVESFMDEHQVKPNKVREDKQKNKVLVLPPPLVLRIRLLCSLPSFVTSHGDSDSGVLSSLYVEFSQQIIRK